MNLSPSGAASRSHTTQIKDLPDGSAVKLKITNVLDADRFEVWGQVIMMHGAVLIRFPDDTKDLHLKKAADGEISVFADGMQLILAGKSSPDDN